MQLATSWPYVVVWWERHQHPNHNTSDVLQKSAVHTNVSVLHHRNPNHRLWRMYCGWGCDGEYLPCLQWLGSGSSEAFYYFLVFSHCLFYSRFNNAILMPHDGTVYKNRSVLYLIVYYDRLNVRNQWDFVDGDGYYTSFLFDNKTWHDKNTTHHCAKSKPITCAVGKVKWPTAHVIESYFYCELVFHFFVK